jgi:hypothetical protein
LPSAEVFSTMKERRKALGFFAHANTDPVDARTKSPLITPLESLDTIASFQAQIIRLVFG